MEVTAEHVAQREIRSTFTCQANGNEYDYKEIEVSVHRIALSGVEG